MTKLDIHSNFISYMERVRNERGYSIAKMSDALGIPQATYKNIIYGNTHCIDITIACKLYDLTHDWMYQMCGYATSDFDVLDKYNTLTDKEKSFMVAILNAVVNNK